MSNDEANSLTPEHKSLLEQINTQYAPRPMTTVQRVEFNKALDARLKKRTTWKDWKPIAVGFAGFALGIWAIVHITLSPIADKEKREEPILPVEALQHPLSHETLVTWAMGDLDGSTIQDELPDEYLAISEMIREF